MKFTCSGCQYRKKISRDLIGRKLRCPKCNTATRVKAPESDSKDTRNDTSQFSSSAAEMDEDEAERIFNKKTTPDASSVQVVHEVSDEDSRQVIRYEIREGSLGKTVVYSCPYCGTRLVSTLNEAGGTDNCPDCAAEFIVPGEKEQKELDEQQRAEISRKAAEREQRTEASSKAVVSRVARQQQKQENLQLARDPMVEWFIYAVVLLGLLAAVAGRYLVSAIQTDSSHLCLMIIVLFALGAVLNFLGMRRLRNEYVCAAVCMNNLKRENGLKDVCQGPAAGIFHQHVIDLGKIAQHDSNLTQDSLVTLLYSRMMAKSKMVDILAGVLVTLGLIGTIVGLISMTDGLSATLASLGDDGEAADLLSGMRSTMSGLGTAFNTTLVGAILGSVVLRILNNVYTSNVDHLVTYVATTTEVNIVPQLKRQSRRRLESVA